MIFRGLFLYALLRGLVDALVRRPDVHRRILTVLIERQVRLARAAFRPISRHIKTIGEEFLELAKKRRKEFAGF
jgi:hypothetical protein